MLFDSRIKSVCAAVSAVATLAVATLGVVTGAARAATFSESTIDILFDGSNTDWEFLAVSPDGSRAYFTACATDVAVVDLADNTVIDMLTLPNDEWVGGTAMSGDGRFFVSTESTFFEIDPATGAALQQAAMPAWAFQGRMVVTADNTRVYMAGDDVYVLDLTPLAFVDTVPGGDVEGLLGANPAWSAEWARAWRIHISPDDDRLYVIGDDPVMHTIDGLTSSPDFTGLTLGTYNIDDTYRAGAPRVVLNQDGTVLFDNAGWVWDTVTMQQVGNVGIGGYPDFESYALAVSPGGAYLFYQGWRQVETLFFGNGVLLDVLDADRDWNNGMTGLDLPGGSFNHYESVATPDGRKLLIAAGGAGAMVVNLAIDSHSVLVPNSGGVGGFVTVGVVGAYAPGTTVSLTRQDGPTIPGDDLVPQLTGMKTRFDLREVPLGPYDVVITPPGGTPWTIPDGFTVEAIREDAELEVIGVRTFLAIDEADLRVFVQNTSNIDQENLTVTLRFSPGTQYKVSLPPAVDGGAAQIDQEYTVAGEELPEYIWIANLTSGQTYEFGVTVKGPADLPPEDWDISLEASVGFLTARPVQRSIIGDLCAAGDAYVTAVKNEVHRQGGDMTMAEGATERILAETARDFGVGKVAGHIFESAITFLAGPVGWVYGALSDLSSCFDFAKNIFSFFGLFSMDPNIKQSSTGLDGYFQGRETIRYIIRFENLAGATAPADTVVITDILDPNLNLSTLKLLETSHPGECAMDLDKPSRTLTVTCAGINLPPNQNPPEGEGWVIVGVDPYPDLASGTQIRNQASIVFDLNEPILTPEVVHEVDNEPPTSAVHTLPETQAGSTVQVEWGGNDTGVGVSDYTVYVSVNDGPFEPWLLQVTETSGVYSGTVGDTVRFFSVARDRLGNTEPMKTTEDTVTRLVKAKDGGCSCASGRQQSEVPFGLLWMLACVVFFLRRRGVQPR